jgi:kinesin family protein C1
MIRRAVNQVFRAAENLKSKGWEYRMDGQFLEIVGVLSMSQALI